MTSFVLDASVALAWFVDNPVPPSASRAREVLLGGARAFVPSLWALEMANGFLVAQKRLSIAPADTASALAQLGALLSSAIRIETDLVPIDELFSIASTFELTAYDAAYLDLARKRDLPLATLDKSLALAARRAGVALFS